MFDSLFNQAYSVNESSMPLWRTEWSGEDLDETNDLIYVPSAVPQANSRSPEWLHARKRSSDLIDHNSVGSSVEQANTVQRPAPLLYLSLSLLAGGSDEYPYRSLIPPKYGLLGALSDKWAGEARKTFLAAVLAAFSTASMRPTGHQSRM